MALSTASVFPACPSHAAACSCKASNADFSAAAYSSRNARNCSKGRAVSPEISAVCSSKYGYTAKQTLDLAQTLYEKRLLTYPRTDSAFLTDDMEDTAAKTVAMLSGKFPFMEGADFAPDVSRTLDSSKVSDAVSASQAAFSVSAPALSEILSLAASAPDKSRRTW